MNQYESLIPKARSLTPIHAHNGLKSYTKLFCTTNFMCKIIKGVKTEHNTKMAMQSCV